MADSLTIALSGEDGYVSVEALAEALESTVKILRQLESQIGRGVAIRWEVVAASMQSPLRLTIAPKPSPRAGQTTNKARREVERTGGEVVRAYYQGMRDVSLSATRPAHFDDDSLAAAKKMAADVGRGDAKLTLYVPDETPVTLSEATVQNIEQVVAKAKHREEVGTLQGRVEVVSTRRGDQVSLTESLTGLKVDCVVTRDQLAVATDLMLENRRVAFTGSIRYRDRKPVSMSVRSIRVLRPPSDLPQPDTMPRIDITGGTCSEDHVRKLRDEQ